MVTVTLEIGPATIEERPAVVDLLVAAQARPDRHICYLSLDAEAIAAELAGLEPGGWDEVLVARRAGHVVGALAVEHDSEPPRVWWHGPVVDDTAGASFLEIGGALLEAGRARLPAHVREEELAGDDHHRDLAELATRHGFETAPASAVLTRPVTPLPEVAAAARVRPFVEADRDAVATIHEVAFPAAHVPGHRVDEGEDRVVLVAERDGEILGYIAVERHEDASGYIDLVGVAPTARGAGVGATLVAAGVAELAGWGCEVVNLTVRETLHGARRLYERLGFSEERLVRPFRRGFSLP